MNSLINYRGIIPTFQEFGLWSFYVPIYVPHFRQQISLIFNQAAEEVTRISNCKYLTHLEIDKLKCKTEAWIEPLKLYVLRSSGTDDK